MPILIYSILSYAFQFLKIKNDSYFNLNGQEKYSFVWYVLGENWGKRCRECHVISSKCSRKVYLKAAPSQEKREQRQGNHLGAILAFGINRIHSRHTDRVISALENV